MKTTDFSRQLTYFLTLYLPGIRNLSTNTIKSYRDAFKSFVCFCQMKGININQLAISDFDYDLITKYLEWLERKKSNGISTRNQRLAAIKSFVRFLEGQEPSYLFSYQKILSIPIKRYRRNVIGYLSVDELKSVFLTTNQSTLSGIRDLCLLTVLYDTAARVQELCDLRIKDLRLNAPAMITLTGKGNKARQVPITKPTVKILEKYLHDFSLDSHSDNYLFFNSQKQKLTRSGVTYIVFKYVENAKAVQTFTLDKVTPHIFRHSKAMHLCQADIDPIYIRDFLGHVKLETTMIYIQINLERKREALEKIYPELDVLELPNWNKDNDLMAMLNSL